MEEQNIVKDIFFKFLMEYKYDEKDLDYTLVDKHISVLQTLASIGNSGFSLFDIHKRQVLFYSSNFGQLLGYTRSDYEHIGQQFFIDRIHPEDALNLSSLSVSIFKIFNAFSSEDKLSHKTISEYRMLNAQGKYTRLIEQYQMVELDKKGQLWLMLGVVDVSSNQDEESNSKGQLLNFKTGQFIPLDVPQKVQIELTKRELEILRLVKSRLVKQGNIFKTID